MVAYGVLLRAGVVVYRLLRSYLQTCIYLVRCGEVVPVIQMSTLSVMILKSTGLCRTKVLPFQELCGERSSLPSDSRWEADKITRRLLQVVKVER